MDSWTSALTEACRQEAWPAVARVHMLELLEMRSMDWSPSESVTSYYRHDSDYYYIEYVGRTLMDCSILFR